MNRWRLARAVCRREDYLTALGFVMRRRPEPLPWDEARLLLVEMQKGRAGALSDAVELAIERSEFEARERWWESLKAARKNRRNHVAISVRGNEYRTYCPVCNGTGYTTGAHAAYGGGYEVDRYQPWIRKPCETCRIVRPGRPAKGNRRNVAEAAEQLTRDAERRGYWPHEFAQPFPRGHQELAQVIRRRHLAAAVAQLADDGFTTKTIETATGLSHAVVYRLIQEGGAMSKKPAELRPSTYWAFKGWTPVRSDEDPSVVYYEPPKKQLTTSRKSPERKAAMDKTRHLEIGGVNDETEELAA